MSTHSPWLQFVTGLLDSPKMEAKGVVMIRGPWHVTPGSLGLLFDMNQSLSFLGLFSFDVAHIFLSGFLYWHASVFLMIRRQAQARPAGQLSKGGKTGPH